MSCITQSGMTKKERTRKKILEAATVLYSEKGFIKTSTEEISQLAGVGKGTVFLHFHSQNELMEEVVHQLVDTFSEQMDALKAEVNTIEQFLHLHLSVLATHEELYFHFITQRVLLSENLNYAYINMQAIFAHHFEMAMEKTPKLSLAALFNNWLGLIHYYVSNRDLFGEGQIISKNKEQWVDCYLTLLCEGGIVR